MVIENAHLDEFTAEEDSGNQPERGRPITERLLDPISPALGLHLVPCLDPMYSQKKGSERYLFQDVHERWYILMPSGSVDDFTRWVYLPDSTPIDIVQKVIRQRTVPGYRYGYQYVKRSEAPEPVKTSVTNKYVHEPYLSDMYECRSCGAEFKSPHAHAVHCWDDHPWVPNPEQVRLRRSNAR